LLRKVIEAITKFIAWVERNKRIEIDTNKLVKVNIGSGLSVVKGWINIDCSLNAFFSKYPRFVHKILYKLSTSKKWYSLKEYRDILEQNNFVFYDIRYGLPFNDNTVDFIYSSHLLEHLIKDDAVELLKEAKRVMKIGGVIRICVPDLKCAFLLYQKGEVEKALKFFFPSEVGYFSRHQYMYDFELLSKLLLSVGFMKIRRSCYQRGLTPDLDKLDNRPEHTLYIEAQKCIQ